MSLETRMDAWNLLMNLPTEQGILRRAFSKDFDWKAEMANFRGDGNVLGQIYLLQVAAQACVHLDETTDDPAEILKYEAFSLSFFTVDVADSILNLFSRVVSQEVTNEWERSVSFRVLIRLLKRLVQNELVSDSRRLSQNLTSLIIWDMENSSSTTTLAKQTSPVLGPSLPVEQEPASELSLDAFHIENELSNDSSNHSALLSDNEGRSLADVLLESNHPQIRTNAYRLLLKISENNRNAVFECVKKTLQKTPENALYSQNFFDFVNEFIVMGSPEANSTCCVDLMEIVRSKLMNYSSSTQLEDATLIGFIDLCKRLVERSPPKEDLEFVETLLNRFVLAIPKGLVSPSSTCLATSPITRQKCFLLLRCFASKNQKHLLFLLTRLESFINEVQIPLSRAGRAWDFHFRSDDSRRVPGTYVGLVNQGATCYQNSVLQQFFMRKEMRTLINRAPWASSTPVSVSGEKEEDDDEPANKKKAKPKTALLRQLQRNFAFLSYSDQKYFNPRGFVNASSVLRLTDSHLSQNDCMEFFSVMIEYLEDVFKGYPEREQLKNLFECCITSLTIRNCPQKHRSEKEENTFYITLSIRFGLEGRALNSLDEAFDEWSKSEHLSDLLCESCFPENDNKQIGNASSNHAGEGAGSDKPNPRFEAGECKLREVIAATNNNLDQVKFITRFPPILVIQLKRFDFDYETLQSIKLNHRVSFEQRIDLGRFTREAVLRQYEQQGEGEEPHVWYRLKGVVVHQGTGANFGHYYSFIEDDDTNSWFRFDDERVTPFDLSCLEEECFGGPVHAETTPLKVSSNYNTAQNITKRSHVGHGTLRNNNGYLLIYKKEVVEPSVVHKEIPRTLPSRPLKFSFISKLTWKLQKLRRRAQDSLQAAIRMKIHEENVAEDNLRALRHSIAFAPDFLNFCYRLIASCVQSATLEAEVGVATFAATTLTRVVLFAECEKERLDPWLKVLKSLLKRNEVVESTICNWFVQKVTVMGDAKADVEFTKNMPEPWIERMLVLCGESRSSTAFTDLLSHAIEKADYNNVESFSETFLRHFPKSVNEALKLVEGNYFHILKCLAYRCRKILLEKDIVFQLIKLMDEKLSTPLEQQPQQVDRHRGEIVTYNNTIVRDEKLCSRVVSALEAILFGDEDDGDTSSGFPLMPIDSSRALLGDSFYPLLVQYAPAAGARLLPRLCDCNSTRIERSLDLLISAVNHSQWAAKAPDAATIIPDNCFALKHLMLSLDADIFKGLREGALSNLLKLVKEGKRQAAERREIVMSNQQYYPGSYMEPERRDQYRAAVLLVVHLVELINALAASSDAYRSFLKHPSQKWGALVNAVDLNSFESFLDGNESCGIRQRRYGKIVRKTTKYAIALCQTPRPTTMPCFTLNFVVEDAGTAEVNGLYRFDGFFPPGITENVDSITPKFARVDPVTGKRFTIFRCSIVEQQQNWYISEISDKPGTTNDIDYYQTKDNGTGLPEGRWTVCGSGQKPAPKFLVKHRGTPNPEDDLFQYFAG